MAIRIRQNALQLTHFPLWGIFMWMLIGVLFIPIGVSLLEESRLFGLAFILCGSASFLGSFLLKKTSVTFDRKTNRIVRSWSSWIGIRRNTKTIDLDQATAIVYECEQRRTAKRSIEQRFSLYCTTKSGEVFHFYPVTYTPRNAEKLGTAIAKFLRLEFKSAVSDRGTDFFKTQKTS